MTRDKIFYQKNCPGDNAIFIKTLGKHGHIIWVVTLKDRRHWYEDEDEISKLPALLDTETVSEFFLKEKDADRDTVRSI